MREIRLSGSEGGGAEMNRLFLPLSTGTAIFHISLLQEGGLFLLG